MQSLSENKRLRDVNDKLTSFYLENYHEFPEEHNPFDYFLQ
jgi:hypothetical protein